MTGQADQPVLTDEEFRSQLTAVVPALRSFARGLCGNRDLADDLVQEAMMRAWRARSRFEAGSNFRAWIYTILRNNFYTTVRKQSRFHLCENDFAERALVEPGQQESHMLVQEVTDALQRVSPAHREVLMLVGANELEYAEAAAILGCAVGTVKSRLCRARKALALELYGEAGPEFDLAFQHGEGMWDKGHVATQP